MKKILVSMMFGIAISAAVPSVVTAETQIEKAKREQAEMRARMEAQRDSLEQMRQRQQAEFDSQNI